MPQDTSKKTHQQYLNVLKNWDKNCPSTTESKNIDRYTKQYLYTHFPHYKALTRIITPKNANWQIDTIEKLLQRDENFQIIQNLIRPNKPNYCCACDNKKLRSWNCPHAKQQAQSRRHKLSRNERKDNQVGDYANREPFQLLKDTLIPQQVFDLYEKEFIPFYCE